MSRQWTAALVVGLGLAANGWPVLDGQRPCFASALEAESEEVTVEGKILSIREIYPPWLTVQSAKAKCDIVLTKETKVVKKVKGKDEPVGPNALREQQQIQVTGIRLSKSKGVKVQARLIRILAGPS